MCRTPERLQNKGGGGLGSYLEVWAKRRSGHLEAKGRVWHWHTQPSEQVLVLPYGGQHCSSQRQDKPEIWQPGIKAMEHQRKLKAFHVHLTGQNCGTCPLWAEREPTIWRFVFCCCCCFIRYQQNFAHSLLSPNKIGVLLVRKRMLDNMEAPWNPWTTYIHLSFFIKISYVSLIFLETPQNDVCIVPGGKKLPKVSAG